MSEARKVFIAIPAHDRTVCASLLVSLVADIAALSAKGMDVFVCVHEQDSNPAHARNIILANFLASGRDDLVSIDHDVSWQPGVLPRLLSHDADFVGGTYRFKKEEEAYPVGWLKDHNDPRTQEGLVEVARLPGGLIRMTREGLLRVTAQCDHLSFRSHICPEMPAWYLYHEALKDGALVTEDYVFCDNIRAFGEKLWLDPELKLNHTGKAMYRGNLDAYIADLNRAKMPDDVRKAHEAKLIRFAELVSTPDMMRLAREATGQAA